MQNRKVKRAGPLKKIFGVVLVGVLILAITGGGIVIYFCATSPSARDALGTFVSRGHEPEVAFPEKDEVSILFMGRDEDRDRHGQVLKTRGRSDCIMLIHADFRNRRADILSIPRDTLVRIPGYPGRRRINAANALGGPDLALDTVESLIGVRPDYYVLVSFKGFEKAIDALGGVEVNVDRQLDYDDNWGNLHIHLRPGRQVLTGEQAMGFVRFRHSNDGAADSDLVRIVRQQELVRALKSKLANPYAIFQVPGILDALRADTEDNLTSGQLFCLAKFAKSLSSDSRVTMATLPTHESGTFVRADLDATRELVRRMFLESQP